MSLKQKKDRYSLHLGWGELFTHALNDKGMQGIHIPINESNEHDIRELRRLHYFIIDKLSDKLFSIDVAKYTSPFIFDCYSMMLWTAPSIKQLIYDAAQYFIYISPQIRLKIIENKNDLEIWLFNNNQDISGKVTSIGFLTTISVLLSIINAASQSALAKTRCLIPTKHFEDNVIGEIEQRFKVKVENSDLCYCLKFDKVELEDKLKNSNENLYDISARAVKDKVKKLNEDDLVCRINTVFDEAESLAEMNIDAVSSKIFISSRTLSRRLAAMDTSFKAILANYRAELALQLLKETNVSMTQIASRLGFSDQSGFNHAFKRWTGYTPLQVRNQS